MWYSFKDMKKLRPIPIGTKIIVKSILGTYVGLLETYDDPCSWTKETAILIRCLKEPEYYYINGFRYTNDPGGYYFLYNKILDHKFKRYDDPEFIQLSIFDEVI